MKKYDSYKDSGIEWIGEIPSHWEVKKIKQFTKVLTGSTPKTTEESYWNGDINWVTTDDLGKLDGMYIFDSRRKISKEGFENSGTNIAPEGSIVISTRAPIGHIGILGIEACTNQGCKTIVSDLNCKSEFLYYHLNTSKEDLNSLGVGTTFLELPTQTLKDYLVPFPNKQEQTAIANFLDRKTSEIDDIIADKKRLLELYEEERTAIINQAVTKGLDPNAPMKDSGIEWLGEIPEHWEVKKLKMLVSKVGSGVTPRGGSSVYLSIGIPLIRSQNVHFDGLKLDDVAFISEEVDEEMSNSRIQDGDVLLNITGASIGRCYFVPDGFGRGNVNQHVCIIRPNINEVSTVYLSLLLRSEIGQLQIRLQQTGANREGLNFEQLKNFYLPVATSLNEQQSIVQHIETECSKIDFKKARTEELIELLIEYRTALISEAVTGKIKVIE